MNIKNICELKELASMLDKKENCNVCKLVEEKVEFVLRQSAKPDLSLVYYLIGMGEMIFAIKEYRSKVGAGLREAKDFVDSERERMSAIKMYG